MDSKQWIHQSRLEHGWIYTMNGGCVHFHNIDVATVYLQQKILDVVEDTLWGQWQMPSCPDSVWWGRMALCNQETAFVCYLYHASWSCVFPGPVMFLHVQDIACCRLILNEKTLSRFMCSNSAFILFSKSN